MPGPLLKRAASPIHALLAEVAPRIHGGNNMKTIDQLVRIAAAGGGMRVSATGKTVDQLVRIAAAASTKQGQIAVTDTQFLTVDQLVRIAAAGQGCVFFEAI